MGSSRAAIFQTAPNPACQGLKRLTLSSIQRGTFVICFPQIRGPGAGYSRSNIPKLIEEDTTMYRTLRRLSVLSFLLPTLFAQFGSGIQGTIVDSTGAVIPNVQI